MMFIYHTGPLFTCLTSTANTMHAFFPPTVLHSPHINGCFKWKLYRY